MSNYSKEAIKTNMIQLNELLSMKSSLASFEQTSQYSRMESEVPFRMFNCVYDYQKNDGENLQENVGLIADKYRERGVKGTWLTYSHEPEQAAQALEEALIGKGFTKGGSMSGMSLLLEDWTYEGSIPPEVKIILAEEESVYEDFKKVMIGGYQMPEAIGRPVCQVFIDDAKDEPSFQYYVAYFENQPACCVMVYVNEGVAGVYAVATLDEFRQKGIAGATVAHSLQEAQAKGAGQAILQASDMGKSVYAKLGFKEEMWITIYSK